MSRLVHGGPAVTALTGALTAVAGHVPYLTAQIELTARIDPPGPTGPAPSGAGHRPPVDGEWMGGQALIDDPRWLGEVIRSTGAPIGTRDPVVAASIFVQGYSYRVLALTVGCFCASGLVPDASAGRMALGLAGGWPSRVAFLDPVVLVPDPPARMVPWRPDPEIATDALRFILDRAVDAHLGPLVAAVRDGLGAAVGERLLWGNVAASAATAFRTMEGCLGSWVVPLGERFFAQAPAELRGLGSFCVVESHGRRGWFWERKNCCLIDRLPGAVRCADCSRTPVAQRRESYRRSLDAS